MPHHKSNKKRLITAEKARIKNKSVRSAISTSVKKIDTTESKEVVLKEMPKLFSMLDKAAKRRDANFTPNKAGNYKRKVHKRITALSA